MAENVIVQRRKRGRPPTRGGTRSVTFKVSLALYEYLTWLRHNSMFGTSENMVALRLLTDKLEEMRQNDYRMPPVPPDDQST